jgi:hypothetical protein
MSNLGIIFLSTIISAVIGFGSWILMQVKELTSWDVFWMRLALIGFISTITSIVIGLVFILKYIIQYIIA